MKMSETLKKKIYGEAREIGVAILSLGFNEKSQSGFFIYGLTANDVVKRIMDKHSPFSGTYLAAKDYLKSYQALRDNTNLVGLPPNSYVQKRFDSIEQALSNRLLDALLSSYGRMARANIEQQRRERMNRRRSKQQST